MSRVFSAGVFLRTISKSVCLESSTVFIIQSESITLIVMLKFAKTSKAKGVGQYMNQLVLPMWILT